MSEEVKKEKKKDKKDKKEKKEKKEKKKEKKKKVEELVVPEIKSLKLKRSEDFLNSEKFRPVPNPLFNPTLISPLTSPKPTVSTPLPTLSPRSPTFTPPVPQVVLMPTDTHGSKSEHYIPSGTQFLKTATRPDPNHSAFNKLQQVVMNGPQQIKPQQQPTATQSSPTANLVRPSQSRRRPDRLPDGTPIVQYARALWDYKALISSELNFKAHDNFVIINKQPDGWWYAQLLDTSKRGLVPGNYMTPN